jgi:hypothetical protein
MMLLTAATLETHRSFAELFIERVGEGAAILESPFDLQDAHFRKTPVLRIGYGQHSQQHGIHQTEDACVRTT